MESQHGVAAYNKGDRTPAAREAKHRHDRRLREMRNSTREYVEGMVMCVYCLCWFSARGIGNHEAKCEA